MVSGFVKISSPAKISFSRFSVVRLEKVCIFLFFVANLTFFFDKLSYTG